METAMSRNDPLLFEVYPGLKGKIPWVPILSKVPTSVERLWQVEKHLGIEEYLRKIDENQYLPDQWKSMVKMIDNLEHFIKKSQLFHIHPKL